MKKYFSLERMADKFCKIVDKGLENVPQQVQLKLPKLKKVESKDTPKIKLPKLKKVEA